MTEILNSAMRPFFEMREVKSDCIHDKFNIRVGSKIKLESKANSRSCTALS